MKKYDVLIVGCGPTGATLANLLRLRGRSVAIFDRDAEIFAAPRAMAIDAESCRIFQTVGVQDRLEVADARPFVQHLFVDKNRKVLLDVDFGAVSATNGHSGAGMRFHQPSLERFLRDDFERDDLVDAFLGWNVERVDGEGDVATVAAVDPQSGEVTEFQGDYLVGADGGSSMSRKYIGSRRVDFGYSRKWIVIDVIVHDRAVWDAIGDMSEFRCRPDAAVVYVKGFHGHVRFDFEVTEEQAASFSEGDAIDLMSEYIDTSSVEFERMTPYHFYAGMPAEWRKGRVFVAGDAAHLTSPFSGQGLNMGIRDAANLAFKLDLVLSGHASDQLLDTYKDERWTNCEKVIQGATERGLMISAGDPWSRLKRRAMFWMGRNLPSAWLNATGRSSIGFPYRNGLLGTHRVAGYQMIQPMVKLNGAEATLLDEVAGLGFTVLMRGGQERGDALSWFENELGGTVFAIGDELVDDSGALTTYLDRYEIEAVLVRPDRYIFDGGTSAESLCRALQETLSAYGEHVGR